MILPQRWDSAFTKAPNCSGESPTGTAPSLASCSFISAACSSFTSSALSRATISGGVALGTKMPFQPIIS